MSLICTSPPSEEIRGSGGTLESIASTLEKRKYCSREHFPASLNVIDVHYNGQLINVIKFRFIQRFLFVNTTFQSAT